MSSSVKATALSFDDHTMWVELDDGRSLGVPLAWFPRLLGATPAQVGLAWVLAQAEQAMLIPGTRSVAHLEQNLEAAGIELSADEVSRLEDAGRQAAG